MRSRSWEQRAGFRLQTKGHRCFLLQLGVLGWVQPRRGVKGHLQDGFSQVDKTSLISSDLYLLVLRILNISLQFLPKSPCEVWETCLTSGFPDAIFLSSILAVVVGGKTSAQKHIGAAILSPTSSGRNQREHPDPGTEGWELMEGTRSR